ncbi:MAG: hypothetical protein Q9201_003054 [Fulgogasparrea decipioides]
MPSLKHTAAHDSSEHRQRPMLPRLRIPPLLDIDGWNPSPTSPATAIPINDIKSPLTAIPLQPVTAMLEGSDSMQHSSPLRNGSEKHPALRYRGTRLEDYETRADTNARSRAAGIELPAEPKRLGDYALHDLREAWWRNQSLRCQRHRATEEAMLEGLLRGERKVWMWDDLSETTRGRRDVCRPVGKRRGAGDGGGSLLRFVVTVPSSPLALGDESSEWKQERREEGRKEEERREEMREREGKKYRTSRFREMLGSGDMAQDERAKQKEVEKAERKKERKWSLRKKIWKKFKGLRD